MSLDLSLPFAPTLLDSSHKAWPKCFQCSERLRAVMQPWERARLGMAGAWYPIEVFGLVGRERVGNLADKYRLVVEANCHGEYEIAGINVPAWFGEGKETELISHLVFFKTRGKVELRTTKGIY